MKNSTIQLITLGCSKNLVDSERLLGQLSPIGFTLQHEGDGLADVVIVNTCGFIHDAKQESIDSILELIEMRKSRGLRGKVVVMGCLSQRYREELAAEIPEVDAWFGARGLQEIVEYLGGAYHYDHPGRLLSTPPHYAYLKISEGCDRTCSFCAIPIIRGGYVSTPVDILVKEAIELAASGVRELILIAQDLTYYGLDRGGKSQLADLLRRLSAIGGLEWIRLHYAYPHAFPPEVLEIMASDPKICKYLDVPLQHINDRILRAMRRGHQKDTTLDFLHQVRDQVPDVALRTTLMVGYPGETHEEFAELEDFVRTWRFDRLGVFTYSPEEGTRAFDEADDVPQELKEERAGRIMEIQEQISLDINRKRIGKTMKVIVDHEEEEFFVARTQFDSPEVDNEVLLQKSEGLNPGDFVLALITGADAFELHGKVVG